MQATFLVNVRSLENNWRMYLAMWKSVQEPPRLYLLNSLLDHVPIPTSRSSCHNILVERKRYENSNDQKIHHSTNSSHRFGDLLFMYFAHILPLQPSLHECWTQPSYHGVRSSKCNAAECERGHERRAIALESVCNDSKTSEREGQETQCFRGGKSCCGRS